MSQRRYRAAVIGLGRIGSTFDEEQRRDSRWLPPHAHAACYRAADRVDLVAGADPYPSQREAFARKWELDPGQVYGDFREMLEREQPDIVSICTSARPRAAIMRDLLSVGRSVKAVWTEKPIAVSLAEADAMVDGCRRAGVVLAIGASRCWDAKYDRMRQLIESGEIGDVLQINSFNRCPLSLNGSHVLTLVSYLAGANPAGKAGAAENANDGNDGSTGSTTGAGLHAQGSWVFGLMESDAQAAGDDDLAGDGLVQFANGVRAFVRTTACGAADGEYDVIGTRGRLRAINDAEDVEFWQVAGPSTLAGRRRDPARHVFPHPTAASTANVRTVDDLIACLETGKEPNCTGEDGRQALEIAIAMRESHRRGGVRVDLPLADRSLRINSTESVHGEEPAAIRRARLQPAVAAPAPAAEPRAG